MAKHLGIISKEELTEMEKLKMKEDAAAKSSEYDFTYQNLQQSQDSEKDKDQEDTSVEDDQPDPDVIESDVATERLRELTYAQEDFKEDMQAVAGFAGTLGVLGISFSFDVLKRLFKGVIYVFVKLGKLMFDTTKALDKYLERRRNSFDNLKKSIASLRASVNLLQEKDSEGDLEGLKYTSGTIIDTLKIGDDVNFSKNIETLTSFVDNTVKKISEQIYHENGVIQHIMSMGRSQSTQVPDHLMAIRCDQIGLRQGAVEGYEPPLDYVEPWHSEEVLPSNVILVAALPRDHLDGLSEINKAYNDSYLVLGFDIATFRKVDGVDYMTIDQLSDFLNRLESLCGVCIAHEAIYEKIKSSKHYAKSSLKTYFSTLAGMKKKVSLHDSFMEHVYLKSMFVDKVYLPCMIDIHDYVSRVIYCGTRFAKSNIDALS